MTDFRSQSRAYLMNKGMSQAASDELYDQIRSAMEHFFDSWIGEHPVQQALGDKSLKSASERAFGGPLLVGWSDKELTKTFEECAAMIAAAKRNK